MLLLLLSLRVLLLLLLWLPIAVLLLLLPLPLTNLPGLLLRGAGAGAGAIGVRPTRPLGDGSRVVGTRAVAVPGASGGRAADPSALARRKPATWLAAALTKLLTGAAGIVDAPTPPRPLLPLPTLPLMLLMLLLMPTLPIGAAAFKGPCWLIESPCTPLATAVADEPAPLAPLVRGE